MKANYEDLKLPKIYKRDGRDCYLDGVRQKLIFITPEETVRQKILYYLVNNLQVPKDMITVEEHLSHYNVSSRRRADIVILKMTKEGALAPMAVVECKAPNVPLGGKEVDQMVDYCNKLEADYGWLTNGYDQTVIKYNEKDNVYDIIEELPDYKDMLKGDFVLYERGELPERIPFDELETYLTEAFEDGQPLMSDISNQTPMEIAVAAFNLCEGLLDTRKKMPVGDYGMFKLIEDYGVRMLSYGNAAGGTFYGPYRSFLIDVNGSTEFVSLNITTYGRTEKPDKIKTCLAVAIDNEKDSHHALQLVFDDNVVVTGNRCDFYHHGRIAVGNRGSGKIDELRTFVEERYPQIIFGKRFFLGSLVNDRLWGMDDPEVIKLVVNLISYALVRDEYRGYAKKH